MASRLRPPRLIRQRAAATKAPTTPVIKPVGPAREAELAARPTRADQVTLLTTLRSGRIACLDPGTAGSFMEPADRPAITAGVLGISCAACGPISPMSVIRVVDTGHPTATTVGARVYHTIRLVRAPSAVWTSTASRTTTCGNRTTTKLYEVTNLEKGSSPRLPPTLRLCGTTRSGIGAEVECSRLSGCAPFQILWAWRGAIRQTYFSEPPTDPGRVSGRV
jgi:hypothetical protein